MENIDWKHLLFKFDGRINRAKFWVGAIILGVIGGIVIGALFQIGVSTGNMLWVYLGSIASIVTIWPSLAISIKRWHDRDKSGWWVLIGLIPIVGGIWAFIETGFLKGTTGPNQYGPDPLG